MNGRAPAPASWAARRSVCWAEGSASAAPSSGCRCCIGPFGLAALEAVLLDEAMSLVAVAPAVVFRVGAIPVGLGP